MATRTAPAITGAVTSKMLSMSWVDTNDKEYTNAFLVDLAVTDAQMEAVVATAQLASNASCWKAVTEIQYVGAKSKANATDAVSQSVADKIRYSMKNLANKAYNKSYIPAPINALVTATGLVDTTNVIYTNWRDAVDASVASAFVGLNVEFVQYSQRNEATSP